MADFEIFSASEGGESYDPAAFERFKEQVKKNAAFVAALRKGEQKHKKKEDKLVALLLRFIKNNQKSAVLLLAAKLLAENIPASVILAIIVLGNEEVQSELKREAAQITEEIPSTHSELEPRPQAESFSLALPANASLLPFAVRAEINTWASGIFEAASALPFQVLETVLDKDGKVKQVVIDCAANILEDFVEERGGENLPYDTYFSFCELLIQAVVQRVKKQIEEQKELSQ